MRLSPMASLGNSLYSCTCDSTLPSALRKDPFSYVELCFQSRCYQQTYACPIYMIPDSIEWMSDPDSDDNTDENIPSTLPPNTCRPPGRPKNKRDRNSPARAR